MSERYKSILGRIEMNQNPKPAKKKCPHNVVTLKWSGDDERMFVQAGCEPCDVWGDARACATRHDYDRAMAAGYAVHNFLYIQTLIEKNKEMTNEQEKL